MIKLVIFDLDGTILYTLPDLCAAMNHALDTLGYPKITLDQARAYIGNGIGKFAQRAMNTAEDDPEIDACLDAFRAYYHDHLADDTHPYPGIIETLQRLREHGIKTAVLSNKYDEASRYLCGRFFDGLFDAAYGESKSIPRKPKPDGVLMVCEKLGVAPEQTVYIGDSDVDYKTSVNSGTSHISVLWGYRSEECLKEAGAVNFARKPSELFDMIVGEK